MWKKISLNYCHSNSEITKTLTKVIVTDLSKLVLPVISSG